LFENIQKRWVGWIYLQKNSTDSQLIV